jgi:hypothetical protein
MCRVGQKPNVMTDTTLTIFARMEDVHKLDRFLILWLRRVKTPMSSFMGTLSKGILLK